MCSHGCVRVKVDRRVPNGDSISRMSDDVFTDPRRLVRNLVCLRRHPRPVWATSSTPVESAVDRNRGMGVLFHEDEEHERSSCWQIDLSLHSDLCCYGTPFYHFAQQSNYTQFLVQKCGLFSSCCLSVFSLKFTTTYLVR